MPRNISITITARSIGLVLAAAALVWLGVMVDRLVLILFLATLLAVAIDPFVDRLERVHVPRAVAIMVIYMALLGVLAVVVGLLVPVLLDEVAQLSARAPTIAAALFAAPARWLAPYAATLGQSLAPTDLAQRLSSQLTALAGSAGELLLSWGTAFTTVLISTVLVLVIGFLLAVDAAFAPRVIARFVPPARRLTAAHLAQQIGQRIGQWVRAQVLVGLLFGLTFGTGLALLGVPYALSLGVAGAVLELIPYVGGAIVTSVALLVAVTISPWHALGVLVLEIVIATLESHVVYPKLVGDRVGLHPLVIILALFVGAEMKGVLGALLAVPVAIMVQVVFDHLYPATPTTPNEQPEDELQRQPQPHPAEAAQRV